jgi:RNA recognition motif-containing protein
LTEELKSFFAKFGEVKSLKLMTRTVEVEGATRDELLGFGYVSFQTLEAAQKARFDVSRELFRGVNKITAN